MNYQTRFVGVLLIVTWTGSLVSAGLDAPAQAASQKVTAKLEKNQVEVTINGKLFTCYKFAPSQKYPYFWPVEGPASGKSITRTDRLAGAKTRRVLRRPCSLH